MNGRLTNGRPWILGECLWPEVRSAEYEVAILPWGATEAHNTHLPYATDTIESTWVAEESARLAWEAGARVVVLPAIAYGVQTGQRDIPFCINMNPSTQAMVLRDIVRSLEVHSPRKLIVLNGHGGNDFKQMIRELQAETSIFLGTINWWSCVSAAPFFDEPGDHAGELETSVMQKLSPHLVALLDRAGKGRARRSTIAGFREGWAWAPRDWSQVTDDTGVGDPSGASDVKGARFLETVTRRIAGFFVELAAADSARMYE